MSNAPYEPPRIDNRALETFMRAIDHAFKGKYGFGSATDPQTESELRKLERQVVKTMMARAQAAVVEQQEPERRLRFRYKFALLRNIFRLRDDIRLRKYNREWLKNNEGKTPPHQAR